jgi:hypothetical protein
VWLPTPADEGRHPPGGGPLWEESWQLDFTTAGGELGGSFRLGIVPALGISRVWACVVGDGRRLVTVLEQEAPVPRPGSLDLRCEGLWTDVVCEAPLEHWSVGLEAFGVALDDPAEALHRVRGDRIGVGFDLGWETDGPITGAGGGDRYLVPCVVHGEVLLGDEVLRIDGWGARSHAWGARDWWADASASGAGRLDDGTRWHATTGPGTAAAEGSVDPPDGARARTSEVTVEAGATGGGDGDAVPTTARVRVGALTLDAVQLHPSPVGLGERAGRRASVVSALARTTAGDGRTGSAWVSWAGPQR